MRGGAEGEARGGSVGGALYLTVVCRMWRLGMKQG